MNSKFLKTQILTLVLLAAAPAGAQTPGALSAENISRIETAISSFMSQQNIPGISVAIVQGNQVRFQRGYGMAEVENFVPAKALTVYRIASVSKSLTAVAAMQLVEKGIRVNAVAPGPIWTPLIPASFDEEKVAKFGKDTPMKRPGQPDEVAPCYVFLVSDDASYISGQTLHPNGGEIVA